MSRRPRLAWFSPMRPVETGVARMSEELLPLLAAAWEVDVYPAGAQSSALRPAGELRLLPEARFAREDRRCRYDAVVYHLSNNPVHASIYRQALRRPGIVVLHDTSLHHLVLDMYLRRDRFRDYRDLLRARYGPLGEAIADLVRFDQLPAHLVSLPLTEEVIDAAQLIVVHNEVSRQAVLARRPEGPVARIPLGVRLPPGLERGEARRRLGLRDDVFVLGSVGPLTHQSRCQVGLRALQALRQGRSAMMILAGRVAEHLALDHLADLYGVGEAVERRGFIDDRQARLLNAAADVCLHLRFPTTGDSSASLLRAMGAGRATLVSDSDAAAELPGGVAAKVPVDGLEDETVLALLEAMADNRELKDALGRNARAYVAREHSLSRMVAGYHGLLERALGWPVPPPRLDDHEEEIDLGPEQPGRVDPVYATLGAAIAELGLGGHDRTVRRVVGAAIELGVGDEPGAGRSESLRAHRNGLGGQTDPAGARTVRRLHGRTGRG